MKVRAVKLRGEGNEERRGWSFRHDSCEQPTISFLIVTVCSHRNTRRAHQMNVKAIVNSSYPSRFLLHLVVMVLSSSCLGSRSQRHKLRTARSCTRPCQLRSTRHLPSIQHQHLQRRLGPKTKSSSTQRVHALANLLASEMHREKQIC